MRYKNIAIVIAKATTGKTEVLITSEMIPGVTGATGDTAIGVTGATGVTAGIVAGETGVTVAVTVGVVTPAAAWLPESRCDRPGGVFSNVTAAVSNSPVTSDTVI